jgi:hypothetical protein
VTGDDEPAFAAALFAAQRAFIAADNCARRAADIGCLFFVAGLAGAVDPFVLWPSSGLRAATTFFFFFDDRCFFLGDEVNLNRSLASFFVSFSILATSRRIFLFKFFRFIISVF